MAGFVVTGHRCEETDPNRQSGLFLTPVDLRFLLTWERIPRGTYRYDVGLFMRPHTGGVWATSEGERMPECARKRGTGRETEREKFQIWRG